MSNEVVELSGEVQQKEEMKLVGGKAMSKIGEGVASFLLEDCLRHEGDVMIDGGLALHRIKKKFKMKLSSGSVEGDMELD